MKKILLKLTYTLFLIAMTTFIGCSGGNEEAKSNTKEILSLVFLSTENTNLTADVSATITGDLVNVTFPFGTDITALIPSIEISEDATISPTGVQNFSNSVEYTVTAEDGSTQAYTVIASVYNATQILSFSFTQAYNTGLTEDIVATIDEENKTITTSFPFGTDITALTPSIEIPEGATISPTGAQDFSDSIEYTITAEDGSTQSYIVDITIVIDDSVFITTWQTISVNESITIFINPDFSSSYNYQVYWGDGTIETNITLDATHQYATPGIHTIAITGDFPAIFSDRLTRTNAEKLLTIENWGTNEWQSMEEAFAYSSNLTYNATDIPNLNNVTNMRSMFEDCSSFNGTIGDWDVSNITNMNSVFHGAEIFNQDIGNWNVSNVTDMREMFQDCSAFNGVISNWKVNNVTEMDFMFFRATNFDKDIGSWNVSSVTSMEFMFYEATVFSQDISIWATDNVMVCRDFSTNSGLTAAQLPTAGNCF